MEVSILTVTVLSFGWEDPVSDTRRDGSGTRTQHPFYVVF